MADIQAIKQRFGIIGNDVQLMRAIEVAVEVAITDMSVLVTGESGVGKEVFSKIIHNYSPRKHGKYIAVNCGAMSKVHSPMPTGTARDTSPKRTRVQYFWTKWANCL